jgi:hypothetical protein
MQPGRSVTCARGGLVFTLAGLRKVRCGEPYLDRTGATRFLHVADFEVYDHVMEQPGRLHVVESSHMPVALLSEKDGRKRYLILKCLAAGQDGARLVFTEKTFAAK